MANQKEKEAAVQTVEETGEVNLLDKILAEGKMARDDFQKERAKDMIAGDQHPETVGEIMELRRPPALRHQH